MQKIFFVCNIKMAERGNLSCWRTQVLVLTWLWRHHKATPHQCDQFGDFTMSASSKSKPCKPFEDMSFFCLCLFLLRYTNRLTKIWQTARTTAVFGDYLVSYDTTPSVIARRGDWQRAANMPRITCVWALEKQIHNKNYVPRTSTDLESRDRSSLTSQTVEECENRCWPRHQTSKPPTHPHKHHHHTHTWRMACLQTHWSYKSALVPRAFWELTVGVWSVCLCVLGVQNLDTKGIPAASDETVWGWAGRVLPGQAERRNHWPFYMLRTLELRPRVNLLIWREPSCSSGLYFPQCLQIQGLSVWFQKHRVTQLPHKNAGLKIKRK